MKTAIAIIVLVVLVAGGYFLFAPKTQAPTQNTAIPSTGTSATVETTNPAAGTPAPATTNTSKTVTVTYDGTTFSPASVTIKKGDTVKFINSSSAPMWVASDPHPSHQGYSGTTKDQHCPDTAGTAFDECSGASTYSFTFQKVGSWGYHNHANHSVRGTVVVTE